jgi:hypothetical protein
MRYIPGTTIIVGNMQLKGSIKNYFEPGKVYYLKNVRKITENEIEYTFTGDTDFVIKQPNFASGDIMIDYLITGKLEQKQGHWETERKD